MPANPRELFRLGSCGTAAGMTTEGSPSRTEVPRASAAGCGTSFGTRRCSRAWLMPARRSLLGPTTTTSSGRTPRSATQPQPNTRLASDWPHRGRLQQSLITAKVHAGLWSPQDKRRGSGHHPSKADVCAKLKKFRNRYTARLGADPYIGFPFVCSSDSGEERIRGRGLNTTITASFGVRLAPFVPFIPPASIAFAVGDEWSLTRNNW